VVFIGYLVASFGQSFKSPSTVIFFTGTALPILPLWAWEGRPANNIGANKAAALISDSIIK
jgi:hypothetical protein